MPTVKKIMYVKSLTPNRHSVKVYDYGYYYSADETLWWNILEEM